MKSFDIAVIGAGISGIALAAALAAQGKRVVVLEQEDSAPYHATGRSAALQDKVYVPNRPVAGLAMLSAGLFAQLPGTLVPKASLHLYGVPGLRHLLEAHARCRSVGADVAFLEGEEIAERFPFVRQSEEHCVAALYAAPGQSNTIDVAMLYQHFRSSLIRRNGLVLHRQELQSAERLGGGWIVRSTDEVLRADVLVNAAGAWADVVAERCGVRPLGLTPLRRTIIDTALVQHPLAPGDSGPFIFWSGPVEDLYCDYRPGGRVWISPADESPSAPCDAAAEEFDVSAAIYRLEERTHLTVVSGNPRRWAGLRTFARDRQPVIGWSEEAPGFFWSAAYGGFGIECAPGAAALACDLLLGKSRLAARLKQVGLTSTLFSPARLFAAQMRCD